MNTEIEGVFFISSKERKSLLIKKLKNLLSSQDFCCDLEITSIYEGKGERNDYFEKQRKQRSCSKNNNN